MKSKNTNYKMSKKQILTITLAVVNGINNIAYPALPVATVAHNMPLLQYAAVDESMTYSGDRGKILDKLFFSTAYASDNETIGQGGATNRQDIQMGETISGTVINKDGVQQVHNGGSAITTTVNSGGILKLDSGGSATSVTLAEGYRLITNTGATLDANNSSVTIHDGRANNITLNDGGQLEVLATHSATNTMISNRGQQIVNNGGSATTTMVNSGGYQSVNRGGSVATTTVNSSGLQIVSSGGSAATTTVNSGGILKLDSGGSATSVTLADGYRLFTDTGATLDANNSSVTIHGGRANNITLNGSVLAVLATHSATNTTINNGGGQQVNSGGSAATTTVNSGGWQNVGSGGNATITTVNSGGLQQVNNGGSATVMMVNSGGILQLASGGSATSVTLADGYRLVTDTGATLDANNSSVTIHDGRANNITLNGGQLEVLATHSATNTTINNGGQQIVNSGGSATTTAVNSGGQQIVNSGGRVTTTTVNSGGYQIVESGGSANTTTVNSGGVQQVKSGGSATTTTVNCDGWQYVSSGGSATTTTVNAGGLQEIASGGSATTTTINSGGIQRIFSGGTTRDTAANSGSTISMSSGAILSGTTTLTQAQINLVGSISGTYDISNLVVNNSRINLGLNHHATGKQLTIGQLTGEANFIINTDLANNQSDHITLNNVTGTTKHTVKVKYDPGFSTGNTITGTANFATVPNRNTTFTALETEWGAYKFTPNLSVSADGTTWRITQLTSNRGSETLRTASDVITANLLGWRIENNSLTKRMGDLRNTSGKEGVWARVYKGEQEIANHDNRHTQQQYNAIQGGYDRKISSNNGTWYAGYALGYLDSQNTLDRGTGGGSSLSIGAYGSWLGDKGHFVDIIAKQSKLKNDYTSYLNDSANTRVDGNYDNWGTSLSVEYGYRKQLQDNWYLEPQVEVNLGRISSASYTTSDNTHVHNHSVNSTIGRLGFAIGRNVGKTSFYGKASLAREFSANTQVTMWSGNITPISLEQNMKESWLEFALGVTTTLDKRTDGYLEITKTTGDKAKTPWQVNVGARWGF